MGEALTKTLKSLGGVLVVCVLFMGGCCACPPPPYAGVQLDDEPIQWAAASIDSLSAVDPNVWSWGDLTAEIQVELDKLPPQTPQEVQGPWPCRWVYGTRREPAACPDVPKQEYRVNNGVLEIDNTGTVAMCAVFHWKDVKDSVWHCGPDNGAFTR